MKRSVGLFLLIVVSFVGCLFTYHALFAVFFGDLGQYPFDTLFRALGVTLRFDLATAAYLLAPVALLLFLPVLSEKDRYLRAVAVAGGCWVLILSFYLLADLLYYPFVARHLSFELLTVGADVTALTKTGLREYWPALLGFCLFSLAGGTLYAWLARRVLKSGSESNRPLLWRLSARVVALVLVAGLIVVASRGGFQMKPITYSDAYASGDPFLGHLALNGLYTTMRTYYSLRENREMLGWGERLCGADEALDKGRAAIVSDTREEVPDSDFPLYRRFRYPTDAFRRLNVVIFMMESWSSKYVGALGGGVDDTPFFSKLAGRGVHCRTAYANAQRSVEAISAVLTSIPPSGGMTLSTSYTLSHLNALYLPELLRRKGYGTFFIHGGKRGTLGLDSLTRRTGMETYIAKEDILKAGGRDDGVWGVFDEDAFLYAHRLFESQSAPFFAVIFSLSSHTPYPVPSEAFRHYRADEPYGAFRNALRYSDHALEKFFETAEKSPYFADTLFIIIGDHAEGKSTRGSLAERFSVPCLFYAPRYLSPAEVEKAVTQTDIAPTILDILRSSELHASAGQSVFIEGPGLGILDYDGEAVLARGKALSAPGPRIEKGHLPSRRHEALSSLIRRDSPSGPEDTEGRCYLQLLRDLIVHDRLYPPPVRVR